jgi:two-component system chemotaxis sensor kinase CheA
MEDLEIIREFVIESSENLARLDNEMVELEQRPNDSVLLASIFRTIHTIKGTCGFLGFRILESITHEAENILSQARNGERELTEELVSLILETVDAIKTELTSIESTARESGASYDDLIQRQREAAVLIASSGQSKHSVKPSPAPVASAEELEPCVISNAANLPMPASEDNVAPASKNSSAADSTIRVDVSHLDRLMNLVGELVLARNQVLQFNAQNEHVGLNATSQRLDLITTELQEGVMKTRMQPIGVVWNRLPRVVRDFSTASGKQIRLEMQGAETELDRTIIESVKDPLTHMVRNSCDHGIEMPDLRAQAGKPLQGTLLLKASHEGGNVIIEINDDGAGIDPQRVKRRALEKGLVRPEHLERMRDFELINLVFLPGFSTAAEVSNISGRGVGMDVVKTNIEKIGGAVDVISRVGQGTTIKVRIPLTLAIIPGLVITSGGERFVIPQASLLELVRLEGAERARQIEWIHGAPVWRRRGRLLSLIFLNDTLKLGEHGSTRNADVFNIVVLQAEGRHFGLVVDNINDTQEIVVKPLGKQLKSVQCYAGATIMGDGKIALILDVLGVARRSGVFSDSRALSFENAERVHASQSPPKQALLLFRAGAYERIAVPLSVVARLEEIPQARVERAAGRAVVQYRGQILRLVALAEHLGAAGYRECFADDPAQVIVFSDGERRTGVVVDQIIDIVEDTVTVQRQSDRQGLLGSAMVGGKVTDFLDLQSIFSGAEKGPFRSYAGDRHEALASMLRSIEKLASAVGTSVRDVEPSQVYRTER